MIIIIMFTILGPPVYLDPRWPAGLFMPVSSPARSCPLKARASLPSSLPIVVGTTYSSSSSSYSGQALTPVPGPGRSTLLMHVEVKLLVVCCL